MTLEAVSHHAETAQQNIDRAGLAERVTILQGKALDTLSQLKEQDTLPFDLIFIDADKPNNPQYLKWALHFSKREQSLLQTMWSEMGQFSMPLIKMSE